MDNNELHSGDIRQNKPVGKLVRVDRSKANSPSQQSANNSGRAEENYSKPIKRTPPVQQNFRENPLHNSSVVRKGNGKSKKPMKHEKAWNIAVKAISIVSALLIIGFMVLNMPILSDTKNGGNVSVYNYIKNYQPVAMEGELNKENVKLDLKPVEEIKEALPELNDGLDLPQLVEGQYSVLFLGFDEEEFNTDVVWVIQFDIGHAAIRILQIPRDTCLPDYTSSPARKFNSIYSMGDPTIQPPIQRTVNAVKENIGIPIDAYITTACFDIVDIVDLIGGIPINIENEIIYEHDKIIPAGDVVLDGKQAEWFIRFRREWIQGDIGRMQNQRKFMAAAMQKLFSIVKDEGRLKLYGYIKDIYEKELLYTDLSIGDLSKIADFASTVDMENVRVDMVPGEDATFYAADGNEYSVYSVHKDATIDLLNNYYRPYQRIMTYGDTSLVELVLNHQYDLYDDTGATLEEVEDSTEPMRDPSKKPWWKED